MHNLHLVVVKADSPQEACDTVESQISEFGNENNWRTICGCVSSKDKVFEPKNDFGGRWSPKEKGYSTIAELNKTVESWMKPDYKGASAIEKFKTEKDITKWNRNELWSLEQYAKQLYEVKIIEENKAFDKKEGKKVKKGFDILSEEYFAYSYAECGVTNVGGEGKETYVVFVDMHD